MPRDRILQGSEDLQRYPGKSYGIVIACWGDFSNAFRPIPELWAARAREVWTMLATLGVEIHCLGTTKEGYPRHPSRLGRNVQPTPWEVKF